MVGLRTGPPGARAGHAVLYTRTARLLEELHVAHGDGSFKRRLGQLARLQLLVLDDFALTPIAAHERGDLLELLDDRVGHHHQPVAAGGLALLAGRPTLADAILDRVVHGAHKIALKGESMRRSRANHISTTEAAMAEDISEGG